MAGGNEYNWWPDGPEANPGTGGYAGPRASGARGGQPPWEQPPPPPRRAQGSQQFDPQRVGPRHSAPWNPGPGPQDQGQRSGGQERDLDQWNWMSEGRPDVRERQFAAEPPEAAPYAVPPGGRHRTGPPGAGPGQPESAERGKAGRMVILVGGGLLVAIVLAGFVLGLSRGGAVSGSEPAGASATPGAVLTQDAQGPAPGAPAVTARSVGGQQVEFSWTYANSATGDTFQVRENGSAQPATVDKPDLVLSAAQGQRVCVQVQVVSAGGATSAESSQACWPS